MANDVFILGYTGANCDPVTCGYLLGNGYRMYLPELMRFSAPDSWSPFGKGGVNPYAYCEADPINHADPSGHFGWFAWLNVSVAAAMTVGSIAMPFLAPAAEVVDDMTLNTLGSNAAREGASAEQAISGTTVVYRYDEHPPEIVSRDGFTGSTPFTKGWNPAFEAYGRNTVFAAKTPEGCINYIFGDAPNRYYAANMLRPTTRTAYLYRIDISGLDSISLVDGFKNAGEEFRGYLARHVYLDRLKSIPFDDISASMKSLIRRGTINSYLSNQEVHVRGPITGNRITHISTYHLPEELPEFWYRF